MAENYGTLEGTLDEHGVLSGEMSDRATLEGEIQFGSGGGGVLDVFQNGQSVVQGRYAYVTVPTFLKDLRADDYHNTVTRLEMEIWNGKADPSDIPTALSQLDNDDNYVQDADYVHTDNNFTEEDKAAIGNIPENITDLSDVAVDNIQNGQVLKWDATQEKFVNADESGGGGDVTDVKVDGTSVVDPVTGEADIDLTGKADKVLDAVAGDFAVLLANGNCANSGKSANDMASKAEMSVTTSGDQTTIQLKSGTSATVINQHQDISGKADKSSLGTAAEKDSTALIVVGSTDLAEAGAVREAIDSAVASSYHHAGTKTCAELVSSLLVRANEGNVYNMTDSGVTTADFIEGAGKPIEEGANVGIAKIAENTYKFDLLSGFIDTSNFIEKSVTSGFVKNDGSIDTNTYQQTEAGKGLSTNDYDNTAKGIVDGVTSALAGKVDKETGKGLSTNDYTTNDKNKLAGIAAGATKTASSTTNGNIKINDVETQVYDDSEIQDKIDETTTSISGNPISISGLKSNQLAKNPIITLEPIQAGSGTPSPSNIRAISGYDKVEVLSCGKNILPLSLANIKLINVQGTWNGNVYSVNNTTFTVLVDSIGNVTGINVNTSGASANTAFLLTNYDYLSAVKLYVGQSYKLSGGISSAVRLLLGVYGSGQEWTSQSTGDTNVNITSVSESLTYRYQYTINSGTILSNVVLKPMMRPAAFVDDTFSPYHKTTDLSESLGQTVYKGSLDVRTGLFTVTHAYVDLGSLTWTYNSSVTTFITSDLPKYAKINGNANPPDIVCSQYDKIRPNGYNAGQNNTISLGNTDPSIYVWIKDSRYTDATTFGNAMSGVQLVYKLATPFTIQLTPHEISLLKDYAYVSTNGTTIALDYHNGELASLSDVAQVGETVNEILSNQTAIFSPSQNVSGVSEKHFFKVGNLVNISCRVTGTFNNGAYTDIGTIAYRPLNIMWFPLINRATGTLAGVIRLTTDGIISVLPSANLTDTYINLMFIANKQ